MLDMEHIMEMRYCRVLSPTELHPKGRYYEVDKANRAYSHRYLQQKLGDRLKNIGVEVNPMQK